MWLLFYNFWSEIMCFVKRLSQAVTLHTYQTYKGYMSTLYKHDLDDVFEY